MNDPATTPLLTSDELDQLPTRLRWEVFGAQLIAGDLDGAATTLAHLRSAGPDTPLQLRAVERLAQAQGRPDAALQAVRERAERFPVGINQADLVLALLAGRRLRPAERAAQAALATRPLDPDLLVASAAVALAKDDVDAARAAVACALVASPDHAAATRMQVRVAWAAGQRDQAVARLAELTAAASAAPPATLIDLADLGIALNQPAVAADLRARAAAGWRQRHAATWRDVMAILQPSDGRPSPALVDVPDSASPAAKIASVPSATDPIGPVAAAPVLPAEVLTLVRDQFGHAELRPGQAEVIALALAGIDTLATMPTGAGKSLCYQVAALALPGTTVVISPLIALMKDQVDSLPPAVAAVTTLINSTLEPADVRARLDSVRAGRYKLVYVAPERLRSGSFLSALRAAGVSLFVVDEAHCISLWGHDFRPDYLFIPRAAAAVGTPRLLALTATATAALAADIERQMRRPLTRVRTSVFRPNLRYEVRHLADREAKLQAVADLCRNAGGPAIVYASSRELCEQTASVLRREGMRADYYHAGLDRERRAAVQDSFMAGRLRVIVATVAFGMGVDKRDVRLIVHLSPPKSLEAYAQESGRAGRDGQPARCVVLYTRADLANLKRWSRDDQLDVDTLTAVHQALVRRARRDDSRWVIANLTSVLIETIDPEEIDVGVVIGLLDRAGLLVRHPDAARELSLRFRLASTAASDPILDHLRVLTEEQGGDGTPLRTARVAETLDLAPAELERRLDEWADAGLITARTRDREACLELLPQPRDSGHRLQRLLTAQRTENQVRLRSLTAYLTSRTCRHALLAAHFDEVLAPCGSACDNCRGVAHAATPPTPVTAAKPARAGATVKDAAAVLAAVRTLPFPVGKTGLTRLLHGSIQSPIRSDRSAAFGALAHLPATRIEALVERLVTAGYLSRDESSDYRLLALTPDGQAATEDDLASIADPPPLSPGQRPARSSRPTAAPADIDMDSWDPDQHVLFERLRRWRTERAVADNVPAYVILHNAVLQRLVAAPPRSLDELGRVPGMGPTRMERYGAELFRLLTVPVAAGS